MTQRTCVAAAVLLLGLNGTASALGLERTENTIDPLFEPGNVLQLNLSHVSPKVRGRDVLGVATGNVAQSYNPWLLAYKGDFNNRLSYAVVIEQPYGVDVSYPTAGSPLLGGTTAQIRSNALTGLLRYKNADGFGVHGGLRLHRASGTVDLKGLAYGPLSGYRVVMANDTATAWVLGASYENPELAQKVVLTYHSSIKHQLATTESLGAVPLGRSTTTVELPEAWVLDLQTGIMENTVLFAKYRHIDWKSFKIKPQVFSTTFMQTNGLVNFTDDSARYLIGVGRQFGNGWSGSVSIGQGGDLSLGVGYRIDKNWSTGAQIRLAGRTGPIDDSPLAPASSEKGGLSLGVTYDNQPVKVSAGLVYTRLRDVNVQTANTTRATFSGSQALGLGLQMGYRF